MTNEPTPLRQIERLKRDGEPVPMPPNPEPYLVEWFFELGTTEPGRRGAWLVRTGRIGAADQQRTEAVGTAIDQADVGALWQ